jgi:protease-4
VAGLAVMGGLVLAAGGVGLALFLNGGLSTEVKEGSFLEVQLDGAIEDAPGGGGMILDPSDFPALLTEVASEIRRAAADPRIEGLYLEVEGLGVGWAGAAELRDAIAEFGASGKPCYAWADALDNKAYYVASACKEVYVSPSGLMLVNGFAVTTEYYAGAMEKLGVTAQLEHVGDFKSAVEPYHLKEPSAAASKAMDLMLDGLYGELVGGIARGRGVSEDTVRAWIDDPPITPESALARGMITGMKYRDQVADELAGEERTELKDYREPASPFATGKHIAIVHADGAIISGESGTPVFGGSMVGDRTIIDILDDVREDEEVAAVVLRVNSPGGSGLASDNIWRALKRVKEAGKPLVVSMGDYAASGGYYIAAPGDWIVAEPSTLTGSIGVFGGKMNLGGVYEKVGITTHTWQRGAMSNLFSPIANFSDPERARFREFLESFYEVFLARVGEGRKMDRDAVHAVAQGRVWTGGQALERGLVDELGGLDVAVRKAAELAELGGEEELMFERFPHRKTFFEELGEDLAQSRLPAEAQVPALRRAWSTFEVLDRVLADGGVAAMMPAAIEVR